MLLVGPVTKLKLQNMKQNEGQLNCCTPSRRARLWPLTTQECGRRLQGTLLCSARQGLQDSSNFRRWPEASKSFMGVHIVPVLDDLTSSCYDHSEGPLGLGGFPELCRERCCLEVRPRCLKGRLGEVLCNHLLQEYSHLRHGPTGRRPVMLNKTTQQHVVY